MKRKPSISFLLSLVAATVVAAAAGLLIYRQHHQPDRERSGVVAGGLRYACHTEGFSRSSDPEERRQYQDMIGRSEEWYVEIASRYPALAVTLRDVPDEKNGFLRWINFTEGAETRHSLDLPWEFQEAATGRGRLDRFEAKRWISLHRGLLDQLKTIGQLPDRSIKGIAIDRWAVWNARLAKQAADALSLEARIAAEDGDEATAVACAGAVLGLADHFDGIEVPGYLHAATAMVIRHEMRQGIMARMIPALSKTAFHPEIWEPLVVGPIEKPRDRARLLRGSWQVTLRGFLLPTLVTLRDRGAVPDAEALVDAYSSRMRLKVGAFEEADDLADAPECAAVIAAPPELSPESRDLFEMAFNGDRHGDSAWMRAQIATSMNVAAFDVMEGHPVPNEPMSGKPFIWDADRRVLALPDEPALGRLKLAPVEVPRLALAR